jgi:hypothetical protein
MDHLRLEHQLGYRQKDYKCPLCLEDISTGRNPSLHIAKHLEEISLAALPQGVDSAESLVNSADQGSQRTGISEATLSDPENMTVNNLGSLYEDQGKLDEAERMYERVLDGKEKALGLETLPRFGCARKANNQTDAQPHSFTLQGVPNILQTIDEGTTPNTLFTRRTIDLDSQCSGRECSASRYYQGNGGFP